MVCSHVMTNQEVRDICNYVS